VRANQNTSFKHQKAISFVVSVARSITKVRGAKMKIASGRGVIDFLL
jgi:hypothetical protein